MWFRAVSVMRRVLLIVYLSSIFSITTTVSIAQEITLAPVEVLFDGMPTDLHQTGNTLFLADRTGVQSINLTDPNNPQFTDRLIYPIGVQAVAGVSSAVALSTLDSLFVFTHTDGYFGEKTFGEALTGPPIELAGWRNRIYYADQAGWGRITLADPTAPTRDFYQKTPSPVTAFGFSDDSLFVGRQDGTILTYHIQGTPQAVDASFSQANISAIVLDQTSLAVAAEDSGVFILDYSALPHPEEVGRFYSYSPIRDLAIEGHYLVAADSTRGLLVLEWLDRTAPTLIAGNGLSGLWEIANTDRYLAAIGDSGLMIFDIRNPISSLPISQVRTGGKLTDATTRGDLGILALSGNGIELYSIEPPAQSSLLSRTTFPGVVSGLDATGDFLAFAAGDSGLVVWDISDPTAPVEIFRRTTIGFAHDVVLDASRILVADGGEGFSIFIMDGGEIRLAGGRATRAGATDAAVRNDIALLAGPELGVALFDISFPFKPEELGTLTFTGHVQDIHLAGRLMFVAADTAGVSVYDISHPPTPLLIASWNDFPAAQEIFTRGNIVYVLDDSLGVAAVDNRIPTKPHIMSTLDLSDPAVAGGITENAVLIAGEQYALVFAESPPAIIGDLDEDGQISLTDAVWMVNYIFRGGMAPLRPAAADLNNDGRVNLIDLVLLVQQVFYA